MLPRLTRQRLSFSFVFRRATSIAISRGVKISEEDPSRNLHRALTKLRDDLCAHTPALQSGAESEIKHLGRDHCVLHFRSGERGCIIDVPGDQLSHAAFLWDERPLFEIQFNDRRLLSVILNQWVCERAMPSQMRVKFPQLEIDTLADYYERGEPIVGEFMQSWDAIEEFYSEDNGDYFKAARALISALREAGYDRRLRAGQSMASLGLSRSQGQGLRDGQPRLWFDFGAREMDIDANFASGGLLRHPIQLTDEVRQLLDALAKHEID